MSDVTLIGVLKMNVELWSGDDLDIMQRHSRYLEAAQRIESDAEIISQQAEEIERLKNLLNGRDGEGQLIPSEPFLC